MLDLKRWKIFRGLDSSLMSKCKFAKCINREVGFLVLQNDDVYVVTDEDSAGNPPEGAPVRKVSKLEPLCGKGTIDFYGALGEFAALTEDGCVYSWKNPGQNDPDTVGIPTKICPSDIGKYQVRQLAHGYSHFLCLTSNGEVFAWGNNDQGQLGLGSMVASTRDARKVTAFSNIVQVAAGPHTSYALDSSGRVWSWGGNCDASLGYISGNRMTPKCLGKLNSIKKIAAGCSHVLALSETGELYFWGSLLEECWFTPTKISKMIEGVEPVIDIGSTMTSKFAVFQNKDTVYLWGIWYEQSISKPMGTELASIDEAFAFAKSPVMLQPIAVNVQSHRVQDAWKRAFNDPSTSDVVFSVGDEKIHAHKAFLKLRSEYFSSMFGNDWEESRKAGAGPIEIPGFSFRVFKAFMYFLYNENLNDDPDMPVEVLGELMTAADYFGDEDLRVVCEEMLKSHLNPDSACSVFAFAVKSNAQNLQDFTVEFMARFFKEVVYSNEFDKMSSDLKTKLVRRFSDLNVFEVSNKRGLQ